MTQRQQSKTEANCVKCAKRTRNNCWKQCGCVCHPWNRVKGFTGKDSTHPPWVRRIDQGSTLRPRMF